MTETKGIMRDLQLSLAPLSFRIVGCEEIGVSDHRVGIFANIYVGKATAVPSAY